MIKYDTEDAIYNIIPWFWELLTKERRLSICLPFNTENDFYDSDSSLATASKTVNKFYSRRRVVHYLVAKSITFNDICKFEFMCHRRASRSRNLSHFGGIKICYPFKNNLADDDLFLKENFELRESTDSRISLK